MNIYMLDSTISILFLKRKSLVKGSFSRNEVIDNRQLTKTASKQKINTFICIYAQVNIRTSNNYIIDSNIQFLN